MNDEDEVSYHGKVNFCTGSPLPHILDAKTGKPAILGAHQAPAGYADQPVRSMQKPTTLAAPAPAAKPVATLGADFIARIWAGRRLQQQGVDLQRLEDLKTLEAPGASLAARTWASRRLQQRGADLRRMADLATLDAPKVREVWR